MNIKERELETKIVDPMDDPERKLNVVNQMESEWPEMTTEFKKLQREQYILFCNKQHDYGPGNISVGSPLKTEEDIKLSLTG